MIDHILANGDFLESTAATLSPGMIVTDLAGFDLGEQAGVVMKTEAREDSYVVWLWMTESETIRKFSLPKDTAYQAKEPPEGMLDPRPYDQDVLDEMGEGESIRNLPESYWPDDPNYEDPLTMTLWRPTYRRYPYYRYYKMREDMKKRTAVRYWYGSEEAIEGYMGIADIELPDEAVAAAEADLGRSIPEEVLEKALLLYQEDLYANAPRPYHLLDSVKSSVENKLTNLLKDPDDEDHYRHGISLIGDNYAHEELFGFIGGVLEYNFKADHESDVEEMTGQPADDVWAELDEAAYQGAEGEWERIHEDVVYVFDEAKKYVAERLVEETEEYLEEMGEGLDEGEKEEGFRDPRQQELRLEGRAKEDSMKITAQYQGLPTDQQEHLTDLYRDMEAAERHYFEALRRDLPTRELRRSEKDWDKAKRMYDKYSDKYMGKESRTAAMSLEDAYIDATDIVDFVLEEDPTQQDLVDEFDLSPKKGAVRAAPDRGLELDILDLEVDIGELETELAELWGWHPEEVTSVGIELDSPIQATEDMSEEELLAYREELDDYLNGPLSSELEKAKRKTPLPSRDARTAAMEWPSQRRVNYPTPDTTHPTFTDDGEWVDEKTPLEKAFPKTKDYPPEMERAADSFWEDYQMFKIRKIPGHHSNESLDAHKYAFMWARNNEYDIPAMRELMDYMSKIGLFPQSTYDAWDQMISYDALLPSMHNDTA
jgi:hypothetical protein